LINRRALTIGWGLGGALAGVGTALFPMGPAWAQSQLRVEVSGIGASQFPIAIQPFKAEDGSPQKISQIIGNDLLRSASFRLIDSPSITAVLDEMSRPELPRLRSLGAELILAGSISKLADGRFDVRARLWDVVKGIDLGAQAIVVSVGDLRFAAHRLSDWIFERITGEKGVAATRITYVTKTQVNGVPRFNLWVADADGESAFSALTSSEPIISPAWSPSGQQLAYVSFESRKAVVYVHELSSGKRRILANFQGSNSAPAWSPDGQSLVVTLSQGGLSQIYLLPAAGGQPKSVTQSSSIDTEAAFAPNGKSVYFVSDRSGSPQVYRFDIQNSAVQRITFSSNYCISPAVSPDGTKLAFIARIGGHFKLMLQDMSTGNTVALTDTTADESPSFSANGRQIIYATQLSAAGRWQEALMTTTLDGRVRSKLTATAGDIREPHWSGFQGSFLK
jgi:TolB protein